MATAKDKAARAAKRRLALVRDAAKQLPPMPLRLRRGLVGGTVFLLSVFAVMFVKEFDTSEMQSRYFHRKASKLTFEVAPGPSDAIVFPGNGPFDQRNGYSLLPGILERLQKRGFDIAAQARLSPEHLRLVKNRRIYPIYHEKAQAGLSVLDQSGKPLFNALYPQLIYENFEAIPPVIVNTLLFIENRDLLSTKFPRKNPTLEWSRLGRAIMDFALSKVFPDHDVPGGSTLATQIEKYRHSPEGRTSSAREKLIQMYSATLRAYLDGRETLAARQRVVTDYINSVPLGAVPGAGEVRGIGHGLVAWHNMTFEEANRLLLDVEHLNLPPEVLRRKALAYKQVLSLFLAQRRPAFYLQQDRNALKELTDKHLGILAQGGIITEEFRKAVEAEQLTFKNDFIFQPERLSFVERKAANAVRVHLLNLFGFDRLYTLDRMDLRVHSTLDYDTQKEVTAILTKLKDPAFAQANGLKDHRLLAQGDPAEVVYSFTLRERVGDANVLRVQADNVEGPFNVSEGGKLELGSTAKLRTIVSYLEIVEQIWTKYRKLSPEELKELRIHPADHISHWAASYLQTAPDRGLKPMLNAALDRSYSANPNELFFTGGGQHRFSNFAKEDNNRVVTMREAVKKSINLPFIRLMRDITYYFVGQIPHSREMLEDVTDPERKQYLTRFANKEGREYLGRFYLNYRGLAGDEVLKVFLAKIRRTPRKLAAVYSVVRPEATEAEFVAFVRKEMPQAAVSDKQLGQLFKEMYAGGTQKLSLQDRGYVAGVHPLELWLISHMFRLPKTNFSEVMEASTNQRQDAYQWLFNSKHKPKQDIRIKIMLEQEAFQKLHELWHKVGFPFARLVPTYATSLGSSGDRPAALADLIGIISAGGIRYPSIRVNSMKFAENTPFESEVRAKKDESTRVLSPELAEVVRDAIRDVVEQGTAVRVKGAFLDAEGKPLQVGGKTGTGDNRYSIFAVGGRVIESKVMSRTATFVFYIGDRFFGTLTAYVPTADAGSFNFTSALPVQILKILAPKLAPLINKPT